MQKDHNSPEFGAEDSVQGVKLAGDGGQSSLQKELPAVLLAAALSAAAVIALAPSSSGGPATIAVIAIAFAALGLGTHLLANHQRLCGAINGLLTGASSSLAFTMDTLDGIALGIAAILYGIILTRVPRRRAAAPEIVPVDGRSPQHAADVEGPSQQPVGKTLQFMEDVIHEIRLPLNTILGFAEILQSPASRDLTESERRTYPQLLLDCSRQLSGFVADVDDLLRMDASHLHLLEQEVDAAELTEIAMKSCRTPAEDTDTTIVVNVIDNIELRCDAARIRRILIALVTRAIRTGRPGGTVSVSFSLWPDGGLGIAIAGNGPMPAADSLELAFEPRLHDGGMDGLSLAIARRIARLHGGDVTVEPTANGNMVTILILPPDRVTWARGNALEAA